MKKYISLFITLNISFSLFPQTVQWVHTGISPGFENGNGIAADDSGNVYVGGQIEYTANFDGHLVSSYGSHDILAVKYNSNGTLQWIHTGGGHGGDVCNGLAIDTAHNVYVAGEVEQTATFDNGIIINSNGANDIFLARYTSGGNLLWVKNWGGALNDKALCAATAPTGECYIAGYFTDTINFGGTTLISNGARDMFVAKINSNGNILWVKHGGGGASDEAFGITCDKNGNVYVAGIFTANATFGSTSVSNNGHNSGFLVKYNSSGTALWARSGGLCCDTTRYQALTTDENGDVYVCGYFNVNTTVGSYTLNAIGNSDVLIAKYSSSGNVLWAKQAGGSQEDIAWGITCDTINHVVYTTGSTGGSGSFDSFNYNISGFKDIFVFACDENGTALWNKINGGTHRDVGSAISVDPKGYVYTTGLFNGIANFDGIVVTGDSTTFWADFYADKISAMPALPPVPVSNLSINQGTCTDLQLTFTPGNGTGVIVIARQNNPVNASLQDGYLYYGDSIFGHGQQLGSGNYIVYNGAGNNVIITGLLPGVSYYFSVIEYSGSGATISYGSPISTSLITANYPVNITAPSAICIGDTAALQAAGAVSYSWSPSSSLSSASGSNIFAHPNATTTYTLNTSDAANCPSVHQFTIQVNPLPVLQFPNLPVMCANQSPLQLSSAIPVGGIYSGPGVIGGYFDPSLTGPGNYILNYLYTDTNGCSNVIHDSSFVKSLPAVVISPVTPMCANGVPVTIHGNHATGTYSGIGVSGNQFDPSVGHGNYLISYSYTGSNGCSDTDTTTVIVNSLPVVNLGNDTTVCIYNSIVLSAGNGFTSYLWSTGSTMQSISVDSSGIGLQTGTLFVHVTDSNSCINSDSINITFDICAGIENLTHGSINIYPNPFVDVIHINSDELISYRLFDAEGKLVSESGKIMSELISGIELPKGIYFLQIIGRDYVDDLRLEKE